MFRIAFIVNESGFNATTSEYFPAFELAQQLTALYRYRIEFITPATWNKPEVFNNFDYLLVLSEDFPTHVAGKPCIAWMRKSLDLWAAKAGAYSLLFVASQIGQEYIKARTGRTSFLLPHAKGEQFNNLTNDYQVDYCFVGNAYHKTRPIEDWLEPYGLGYKFRLYGHGWDHHTKWKPYWKGPVEYPNLPKIYSSSKITIDDTSETWGCVNSRVFDAAASGSLVITNDPIGNLDTFDCQLPVYKNQEELIYLLRYYLMNEDKRQCLVDRLKGFVSKHTYQSRAKKFQEVLFQHVNRH